jgi:hypothetical protein
VTPGRAYARYCRDVAIVYGLRRDGLMQPERANDLALLRFDQYLRELGEAV